MLFLIQCETFKTRVHFLKTVQLPEQVKFFAKEMIARITIYAQDLTDVNDRSEKEPNSLIPNKMALLLSNLTHISKL